jgi:hypothetical protein
MTGFDAVLLVANLATAGAMAGLIWFVQVVHYPLFAGVGADRFRAYEHAHRWRTSLVVGPLMGVELLAAAALALAPPPGVNQGLAVSLLAVLLAIHVTTAVASIPAHDRLNEGFDGVAHRRLCRTNWVRTAGWTTRAIGAAVLVAGALPA